MSSTTAFRPGIALGVYPERKESKQKPLEGMLQKALGRFKRATSSSGKHGQRFVVAVDQRSQALKNLDDETFRQCCK